MKKLWNKFTDTFGKTIFHPQYIMNSLTGKFIEALKKNGKGKLLDVGCGRSPYKDNVLKYVESYTGVDHPKVAKLYDSINKPDYYADASKLPFTNGSFDTVIMLQVLEYLEKPQLALNELKRVLKKDGTLILTSPFMYPLHDGKYDRNRFTKEGVIKMLQESGFSKVNITVQGNFFDFAIQSFLIFYFKKVMQLSSKKNYRLIAVLLTILGLVTTPPLNLISILFKPFDKESDFPLDILAIAKN